MDNQDVEVGDPDESKRELTAKQQRFASAYADPNGANGNATLAAKMAGYKGGDNQLAVQGSLNLKNKRIRQTIAEAFEAQGCTLERAAVAVAEAERAELVREAQRSAPGHDFSLLGRLTPLPGRNTAAAIGWDGPEAQLIVHNGHAPGHGAVFLPGTGVLVAGDMCSDVEIPLLDLAAPDPLGDYRLGLQQLAGVPGVRQVVPGHGHVGDADELRRRLAADAAYLDALALGKPAADPRLTGESPEWLRVAHDEQLRYIRGPGS